MNVTPKEPSKEAGNTPVYKKGNQGSEKTPLTQAAAWLEVSTLELSCLELLYQQEPNSVCLLPGLRNQPRGHRER